MIRSLTTKPYFIFYLIVAFLHLGVLTGMEYSIHSATGAGHATMVALASISMITKVLLLFTLMIYFYCYTIKVRSTFTNLILLALVFSWVGDILLLFQEKDPGFFLSGLLSFLAAHIFYIIAFTRVGDSDRKSLLARKPVLALPFIAYGVFIFFLIRKGLGSMMIPVIVYECIILLMGISALNRYKRVSTESFQMVFSGAILFMISDTLLAINKFREPFAFSSLVIMFTYITAQYFIVKGSWMHVAKNQLAPPQAQEEKTV